MISAEGKNNKAVWDFTNAWIETTVTFWWWKHIRNHFYLVLFTGTNGIGNEKGKFCRGQTKLKIKLALLDYTWHELYRWRMEEQCLICLSFVFWLSGVSRSGFLKRNKVESFCCWYWMGWMELSDILINCMDFGLLWLRYYGVLHENIWLWCFKWYQRWLGRFWSMMRQQWLHWVSLNLVAIMPLWIWLKGVLIQYAVRRRCLDEMRRKNKLVVLFFVKAGQDNCKNALRLEPEGKDPYTGEVLDYGHSKLRFLCVPGGFMIGSRWFLGNLRGCPYTRYLARKSKLKCFFLNESY